MDAKEDVEAGTPMLTEGEAKTGGGISTKAMLIGAGTLVAAGGIAAAIVLTMSGPADEAGVVAPFDAATVLNDALPKAISAAASALVDTVHTDTNTTAAGAVLPSGDTDSCVRYDYVRTADQAELFGALVSLYASADDVAKGTYTDLMVQYASFTELMYNKSSSLTSSGRTWSVAESRVNPNGEFYDSTVCGPQNDAVARRALTMMRFIESYAAANSEAEAKQLLANEFFSETELNNPLGRDLEYLMQNAEATGCDRWEERLTKDFYSTSLMKRALVEGAAFIRKYSLSATKDATAVAMLAKVDDLDDILNSLWKSESLAIGQNWNSTTEEVNDHDITTIIAATEAGTHKQFQGFGPISDYTLADVATKVNGFGELTSWYVNTIYPNSEEAIYRHLGVAIGRYKSDSYSAATDECPYATVQCPEPCLGQAWFISSNSVAQVLYNAVREYNKVGLINFNERTFGFFQLFGAGEFLTVREAETIRKSDNPGRFNQILAKLSFAADSFLLRSLYHAGGLFGNSLNMSEMFNIESGKQLGSPTFVPSYASLITAANARASAKDAIDAAITNTAGTPDGKVLVEVVVTNVQYIEPESEKGAVKSVSVVSNAPGMGGCGVPLSLKRSNGGVSEYSAMVAIPANTKTTFRAVLHDGIFIDCDPKKVKAHPLSPKATIAANSTNPAQPFIFPACLNDVCAPTTQPDPQLRKPITFIAYDVPEEAKRLRIVGNIPEVGNNFDPCVDVSRYNVFFEKVANSTGEWRAELLIVPKSFSYKLYQYREGEDGCRGNDDSKNFEKTSSDENSFFDANLWQEGQIVYDRWGLVDIFRGGTLAPTLPPPVPELVKFRIEGVPAEAQYLQLMGGPNANEDWDACDGIAREMTPVDGLVGVWEGEFLMVTVADFELKWNYFVNPISESDYNTDNCRNNLAKWDPTNGNDMFVANAFVPGEVFKTKWGVQFILGTTTFAPTTSPTVEPEADPVLVTMQIFNIPAGTQKLRLATNDVRLKEQVGDGYCATPDVTYESDFTANGDHWEGTVLFPAHRTVEFKLVLTTDADYAGDNCQYHPQNAFLTWIPLNYQEGNPAQFIWGVEHAPDSGFHKLHEFKKIQFQYTCSDNDRICNENKDDHIQLFGQFVNWQRCAAFNNKFTGAGNLKTLDAFFPKPEGQNGVFANDQFLVEVFNNNGTSCEHVDPTEYGTKGSPTLAQYNAGVFDLTPP